LLSRLAVAQSTRVDEDLQRWLGPQEWTRDTDGPVVSLGPKDSFDDQHIFAPCVARVNDKFLLWYCGSRGTVLDRVFGLGLMNGTDGRTFVRHPDNLVLKFADERHSILTPTLLSNNDGTPIRENGKLRMWFSGTDFHDPKALHTLHETTSDDGVHWSEPSPALLKGLYAPTVLKDGDLYRLWFTDVSKSPWVIRYAESRDGKSWQVEPMPVLKVDQPWELDRLFYPTVRKVDGVLLMWYGSYWKGQGSQKTALGFAVSRDGRVWTKSPHNPVFRPDANRPWESHYVTSQSLIRFDDGSWRIWYASRTKPPFVHKYFAIGTAKWAGPQFTGVAK
ncbi:MAG TPA: hypothetical protein VKH44_06380, partial [Pirellulaceae bacterium]|nr:hypothetical protein [Pirellulaceae bacterium]